MGQIVDKHNETLERFRDLNPPEEDKETIDQLVALQVEQISILEEAKKAAGEGNNAKASAIFKEFNKQETRSIAIHTTYGLMICG